LLSLKIYLVSSTIQAMSQKGRVILKEYFKTEKIPSETNFSDLVDSVINKTDDQLFIQTVTESSKQARYFGIGSSHPQSPLSIRNRTETEKLVGFENNLGEEQWHIDINPDGKNGLNIEENKNENSKLFIQSGGNVGIGTASPQAKLDVNGAIRITDGTEGAGKILTSDNTGKATWSIPSFIPKGFSILSDTPFPPPDFTFTGLAVNPSPQWLSMAPMPTPRGYAIIAVVNAKIYVIGGVLANNSLSNANEEYDPGLNVWTKKAPMPTSRSQHACGVVNNKIYVIGGSSNGYAISTNEEYDPVLDKWTTKSPMPTNQYFPAIGVVGNKIYTIGGWDSTQSLTTGCNAEYDPATNTWSIKTPMPTTRVRHAVGVVNNKIYVIGGYFYKGPNLGSADDTNANEEYDPVTNQWKSKTPMPTMRNTLAIGVANSKIYTIGGVFYNKGGMTNVNEEYNPATNLWATSAPISINSSAISVTVFNNIVYSIGGIYYLNGGNIGMLDKNEALNQTSKTYFIHVKN